MQQMNKQSGFTLVEIAIVLVIIGLLLGGVLKGQEMIKNAEIRGVISEIRGLSTAMYAYRDRYNAIPGDDAAAITNSQLATGVVNGDGDGVISDATDPADSDVEGSQFFLQLRAANLLKGAGATGPTHSLGGVLSVDDGLYGLSGTVFCASGVDRADALIIDTKEDDGVISTGSIQGGTSGSYASGTAVLLCFES